VLVAPSLIGVGMDLNFVDQVVRLYMANVIEKGINAFEIDGYCMMVPHSKFPETIICTN
jgi:hypothetical protein